METKDYDVYIKELFSGEDVYILARDLNQKIVDRFGITPENSRKIVQRAVQKGVMRSSSPVTFGKRQYLYFNNNVILDRKNLADASKKYRPHLYYLIEIMELNDGIISYYEALKITASPVNKSTSKIDSLEELVLILKNLNIIREVIDSQGAKYLLFAEKDNEAESLMLRHFVKITMDTTFIKDMLYWLQRHNLIDNSNTRYRNSKVPYIGPNHNNFVWDAFAYTRTTGYSASVDNKSEEREKSTLVVIDIVISREYTEFDLQGFYDRIQVVRNSTKSGIRKILPMIFYKDASAQVINRISSLGFLNFNISVIFGEKIYNVINKFQLIKLEESNQSSNLDSIVKNIEDSLSVIRNTGQETNLANIKGDLFESLMYPLIREIYPSSNIQQGKKLRIKDEDGQEEGYEYDYIVRTSNYNEIIIIELKGYKSTSFIKLGDSNTRYTVRWFFRRTFPFAQRKLQDEEYTIKGCYITTAQFQKDAIDCLEKINNSIIKPSQLDAYYDGEKLIQLLKSRGQNKVIEIIKKYYFDN